LSPRPAAPVNPEADKAIQAVKTSEDAAKLPFFARAQLASAAAWSPNPNNPPLYLDLPIKGGESQPDVLAKWAANAPLAFIDQYIAGLRRYRAISLDVGDKDGLRIDHGQTARCCWTNTVWLTDLKCIRGHILARWPCVFRIMFYRFSARIYVLATTVSNVSQR